MAGESLFIGKSKGTELLRFRVLSMGGCWDMYVPGQSTAFGGIECRKDLGFTPR
jgi:hypothetical protein